MSSGEYIPQRGDIAWLTLDPALGHEQRGRRPVVVLSSGVYNGRTGMLVCCPVTSQVKGYPLEVRLPSSARTEGVALTDQLKGIDWRQRNYALIEQLPADSTRAILRSARILLNE